MKPVLEIAKAKSPKTVLNFQGIPNSLLVDGMVSTNSYELLTNDNLHDLHWCWYA